MTEWINTGNVTVESEFQKDLSGACGPNGAASAARWVDGDNAKTTVTMTADLQHVINSPNGVSTLSELRQMMRNLNYHIVNRNQGESAIAFAERVAGRNAAVVMFYSNGQALKDFITNSGEDANNLRGHFNCLHGYNSGGASPHFGGRTVPAGFIVADGDNNVQNPIVNGARVHRGINTQMVYYTVVTMEAAGASDAFAVIKPGATTMGLPTGWSDDGTSLHNPVNAFLVTGAKRQMVLDTPWGEDNVPLENVQNVALVDETNPSLGGGNAQTFRKTRLIWPNSQGKVMVDWIGQEYLHVKADRDAKAVALANADAEVSQLQAQVAELQQQLAAAQQSGGTPPPVVDQAGEDAKAAIAALKKAMSD